MKSADSSPPFGRGEIYDPARADTGAAAVPATIVQALGREWDFQDINLLDTSFPAPGPRPIRSGHDVTCRLMKNNSGVTIYPKRIVTYDRDNPGSITGLAAVANLGAPKGVVDEYVPAAGVPNGAYCWMVVEGRSLCVTDAAVSDTSITVGMNIAPATGGFANGTGTIVADGALTSASLNILRHCRIEARTAYTGSAAAADITVWVYPE